MTATTTASADRKIAATLLARLAGLPMSRWHGGMIFLAGSILLFDNTEVGLAISAQTSIMSEMHLSTTEVGMMISSGLVGATISSALQGPLQSRLGRRTSAMVLLAMSVVFTVGCALSQNLVELMIFRFLAGLGFGALIPLGWAFASEIAPTKWFGRVNAWMDAIGYGGGSALAYGIGALIVSPLGFRWGFGAMAIVIALVFLFTRFMPESIPFLVKRGRIAEATELVDSVEKRALRSHRGSEAALSVTAELTVETESAEELEATVSTRAAAKAMFARGNIMRLIAAVGTWWIPVLTAVTAFFPIILVKERHMSAQYALTLLFAASFVSIAGRFLAGPIADKVNKRVFLSITLVLVGLGPLAVILVPGDQIMTSALVIVSNFANGLWGAAMFAYVPTVLPPAIRSTALGLFVAGTSLCSVIGPILVGAVYQYLGILPTVLMFAAACAIWALFTLSTGWKAEASERSAALTV